MPTNQLAAQFRARSQERFNLAATAFSANPDIDSWLMLKMAMWDWQRVHFMGQEQLEQAAYEALRADGAAAKGDFEFGESEG